MEGLNTTLSLDQTQGWNIHVSNFPPDAPSPTRRMSVQFVLNEFGLPMRSDDQESFPRHQPTEQAYNANFDAVNRIDADMDSRSPTPISLVSTGLSTPPMTKPQFKRTEIPILPKCSPPQEEDWKDCIRTRAQLRTILGMPENAPLCERRQEEDKGEDKGEDEGENEEDEGEDEGGDEGEEGVVPRKRRKTISDFGTPPSSDEIIVQSTPPTSSKKRRISESKRDAALQTENAPQVSSGTDSRYDPSVLVLQDGEWKVPRSCAQFIPTPLLRN